MRQENFDPERSDVPLAMEVTRTPDEDTRLLINDLKTEMVNMNPQAVKDINELLKELLAKARSLRNN